MKANDFNFPEHHFLAVLFRVVRAINQHLMLTHCNKMRTRSHFYLRAFGLASAGFKQVSVKGQTFKLMLNEQTTTDSQKLTRDDKVI